MALEYAAEGEMTHAGATINVQEVTGFTLDGESERPVQDRVNNQQPHALQ